MCQDCLINPQSLPNGSILNGGRLVVRSLLAKGGNSFVYIAEDQNRRLIVIKEFFFHSYANRNGITQSVQFDENKTDVLKQALLMFRHEFYVHKAISYNINTNIPDVLVDLFEENSTLYYGMQYLNGKTLFDIVKGAKVLSEQMALYFVRNLIEVIKKIHNNGWLFLDISPKNVVIMGRTLFLVDFGNARSTDENYIFPLSVTEGFTAPEIIQNKEITKAADYYSIGTLLFYCVTGKCLPYDSSYESVVDIMKENNISNESSLLILELMNLKKK